LRPTKEFKYESGKSKLINLRLDYDDGPRARFIVPDDSMAGDPMAMDEEYGRQEHLLKLSGFVDMNSQLTVSQNMLLSTHHLNNNQIGCSGAVISYLMRRRAASHLPGDQAAEDFFRIKSIEMFSIQNSVYVLPMTQRFVADF
jgi:DNA mismatch repair protein MSH5